MTRPEPQDELPVAISYSMGASSKWLIEAVIQGWLPRPRYVCVVCADTGSEHEWSYDDLAVTMERCRANGIEFIKCGRAESLHDHLLSLPTQDRDTKRLDHPPFWIDKGGGSIGRAMHRCTREFKVAPMRRAISDWLKRIGKPKRVVKWIGYSLDESIRVGKTLAKQDVHWESLDFPAIRLGKVRGQLRQELASVGVSAPRFSMCRFCPFKDDRRWRETSATDLDNAITVDEAIRDLDEIGLTDGPAYLTRELIPVASLVRTEPRQLVLPGVESYCDGGACFL